MFNTTLQLNVIKTGAHQSLENNITGTAQKKEKVNDVSGFHRVLQGTISENSANKVEDKKLMDVCIDMESLFVAKMLKEMKKTVHKTEWLNGGYAEEVFEDMLYDEYALQLSKNSSLGLADMIYRELDSKV